ncbi:MAG: hypothetical protein JNM88_20585 [Chitinophagaceae bacterium]|nr:hypothetical protein [Chitinophagaceae bacterium]
MEYKPPLSERQTNELLDIISNEDEWVKEAQQSAEEELRRRNISNETIAAEKVKRIKGLEKIRKQRVDKLEANRTASYSLKEMIAIVVFFPFSLFLHLNPLAEFWKLDAGNYKRKIWQRSMLIVVSIFLWIQLVRVVI